MNNRWFIDMDFTKQPLMGGSAYVVFYTKLTNEAAAFFGSMHENGAILLNNYAILESYNSVIGYVCVEEDMFVVKVLSDVNKQVDADMIEKVVKEYTQNISNLLDEILSSEDSVKVYRHGMLPIPANYDYSIVKEIDIVTNKKNNTTSYVYELSDEGFDKITEYISDFKKLINPKSLKCKKAYLFKNIKSVVAVYKGEFVNFYIVDGVKDALNLFTDYKSGMKDIFTRIYDNFNEKGK